MGFDQSMTSRTGLRDNLPRIIFIVALIVVGMLARFLPYPPNFSPIGAMALFAGSTFGAKFRAALIPLTTLIFKVFQR